MIAYLIKSLLCLFVLYGFYWFFLEAENMHRFKRFYLIGSVIFSFILPLITFSYTLEYSEQPAMYLPASEIPADETQIQEKDWYMYLAPVAVSIYVIGVIIMGFRFFRNLYSIQKDISNNQKLKDWNYIFVLLKQKLIPHSFLNYIFLAKAEYENDEISATVIEHEKAHVDQRHSLDVLFLEFLQVVFWFNPVFIWLKRSARLNHEFLADQQVLEKSSDAVEYSNILLSYGAPIHHNSLSSSISNSLIKKRIIMISKNFSLKRSLGRIGFLIPVLALCIYFFNNEIVAKPAVKINETGESSAIFKEVQDSDIISIRLDGDKIFLNSAQVKLKSFAAHLDELLEDKSDADLKEMNFHMQTRNAEDGLLDLLNREFKKTRFSKVTGRSVLPPPPPMPAEQMGPPPAPPVPENAGDMPPAPPAPKPLKEDVPPPPPAPVHERKQDSLRMAHMNHRDQIKEQMRMERDFYREEMEQVRAVHQEMREEYRDSIMEQREIAMRHRLEERRAEVSEERQRIREKQEALRAEHQRLKEMVEKEKQLVEEKKKDSI